MIEIPKDCSKCTLCKIRNSVVESYVSEKTKILFIIDVPSEGADKRGDSFLSGGTGQVFNNLLYSAGLSSTDDTIGITYAVRCRPNETDPIKIKQGKKIRTIKDTELNSCSEYLIEEIKSLPQLSLIVCLGATSSKAILGSTGVTFESLKGKFFNSDYGKVLVTSHPSRLLYTVSAKEKAELLYEMETDFKKISNLLTGKVTEKIKQDTSYKVIRNMEQAKWLFDKLLKEPLFTFDLETSSLDFISSEILCISFSWKEKTGYVLPFFKQGLIHFWNEEDFNFIYENLKIVMENTETKKVAHNGKFDMQHLRAFGIYVQNFYADTMLMHFCLNENEKHGLKELSWAFTDMGGYDDALEDLRKSIAKQHGLPFSNLSYSCLPEEDLWQYAAADTDATLRLFNKFYPLLVKENLWELCQSYYTPMSVFLTDLEFRGVSVDLEYLKSTISDYTIKISNLEKLIEADSNIQEYEEDLKNAYRNKRYEKWVQSKTLKNKYTNYQDYCDIKVEEIKFNPGSYKQLGELFIKKLKMPCIKTTDSGNPSIDAEVLDVYSKDIPVASLLSKKNKLSHLVGTFLVGMQERIREDKKLHTSFNLHVASTARLSSTNPNLQNIPNKTKNPDDAQLIRNIFIADEDCVLLEADYGQAEFRIWAQLSGDEVMYDDLVNGIDIHRKFASIGFGIPEDQVDSDTRNKAKAIVFGTMYGRSPESVASDLGISVKDAIVIQQSLFKRYKKAAMWVKIAKVVAKRDGYVTGLFGQKRRLKEDLNSMLSFKRAEAERQAVNAPIQGSASQMTCFAALKIHEELKQKLPRECNRILMLIHDAIVLNVHKDDVEESLNIISECMLSPHPLITVPLKIDIKCGIKWGNAKEMKRDEILEYVKNAF